MSRTDAERDPSVPKKILRTATPPYSGRRDTEMDVIGWGLFLALLVLLVPLLPVMIAVWAIFKFLDWIAGSRR